MADSTGRFVWYELMTTDLAAAREFYSRVVGWKPEDAKMPGMEYWLFNAADLQVAGLMKLPDEAKAMGTPPCWIGYVAVADVDAAAAKVPAAGGTVHVQPTDIPNVGRFAVVTDPAGATFSLFKSANSDQEPPLAPTLPGHVGWHELYGADVDASFAFYSKLFPWVKKQSMDMGGDMGTYQTLGIGDVEFVGMMKKPPMMPVAAWGYYFNVGNIDDAAERVKAGGGNIMQGPIEVPGGGFMLQATDPQGAAFALLGSR